MINLEAKNVPFANSNCSMKAKSRHLPASKSKLGIPKVTKKVCQVKNSSGSKAFISKKLRENGSVSIERCVNEKVR